MRALVFLGVRSFVNSVRRAITSPKRIVGLVFFLLYFGFLFRPLFQGAGSRNVWQPKGTAMQQLELPPLQVIEAAVFGAFLAISYLMLLGVFGYKGAFRPADVETLFPTPVSPKLVLAFRLARDYFVTLIVPLLIAIFFIKPVNDGLEILFKNAPNPSNIGSVFRFMSIAWILMAIFWVALSYAVSIYLHQPEEKFERRRRLFNWAGGLLCLVPVAWIARLLALQTSPAEWLALAKEPWLHIAGFPATAASQFSLAPVTGNWIGGLIGLALLIGLIALAVWGALAQADRLYEQAALRANTLTETKSLQSSGDFYGMIAKLAREGKIKTRRQGWVHRLRLKGPTALLWKEYILQFRAARASVLFFLFLGLTVSVLPILALHDRPIAGKGALVLMAQTASVFVATMFLAQANMVEAIRRIDLQKPLPFSSTTLSAFEIFGKAFVGILVVPCGVALGMLIRLELWPEMLASLLMLPTLAFLLSAVSYVMILLLPDVDDPTQRGFRGLVNMLGIALLCAPSVILYVVQNGVFKVAPPLAAIPVMLINIVLGALTAMFAGKLYENFNPSE